MSNTDKMFTRPQRAAFDQTVERLQSYGLELGHPDSYYWSLDWAEEVRPGRGQDLNAQWMDGEHYVQIRVGVYGDARMGVAEVHWLHGDGDEFCECDPCLAGRISGV